MAADNIVLLGGEFDNAIDGATAAYLLHTSSRADAEAWAAKDPLVSHGRIVLELSRGTSSASRLVRSTQR